MGDKAEKITHHANLNLPKNSRDLTEQQLKCLTDMFYLKQSKKMLREVERLGRQNPHAFSALAFLALAHISTGDNRRTEKAIRDIETNGHACMFYPDQAAVIKKAFELTNNMERFGDIVVHSSSRDQTVASTFFNASCVSGQYYTMMQIADKVLLAKEHEMTPYHRRLRVVAAILCVVCNYKSRKTFEVNISEAFLKLGAESQLPEGRLLKATYHRFRDNSASSKRYYQILGEMDEFTEEEQLEFLYRSVEQGLMNTGMKLVETFTEAYDVIDLRCLDPRFIFFLPRCYAKVDADDRISRGNKISCSSRLNEIARFSVELDEEVHIMSMLMMLEAGWQRRALAIRKTYYSFNKNIEKRTERQLLVSYPLSVYRFIKIFNKKDYLCRIPLLREILPLLHQDETNFFCKQLALQDINYEFLDEDVLINFAMHVVASISLQKRMYRGFDDPLFCMHFCVFLMAIHLDTGEAQNAALTIMETSQSRYLSVLRCITGAFIETLWSFYNKNGDFNSLTVLLAILEQYVTKYITRDAKYTMMHIYSHIGCIDAYHIRPNFQLNMMEYYSLGHVLAPVFDCTANFKRGLEFYRQGFHMFNVFNEQCGEAMVTLMNYDRFFHLEQLIEARRNFKFGLNTITLEMRKRWFEALFACNNIQRVIADHNMKDWSVLYDETVYDGRELNATLVLGTSIEDADFMKDLTFWQAKQQAHLFDLLLDLVKVALTHTKWISFKEALQEVCKFCDSIKKDQKFAKISNEYIPPLPHYPPSVRLKEFLFCCVDPALAIIKCYAAHDTFPTGNFKFDEKIVYKAMISSLPSLPKNDHVFPAISQCSRLVQALNYCHLVISALYSRGAFRRHGSLPKDLSCSKTEEELLKYLQRIKFHAEILLEGVEEKMEGKNFLKTFDLDRFLLEEYFISDQIRAELREKHLFSKGRIINDYKASIRNIREELNKRDFKKNFFFSSFEI